jgi:hypothetical protein
VLVMRSRARHAVRTRTTALVSPVACCMDGRIEVGSQGLPLESSWDSAAAVMTLNQAAEELPAAADGRGGGGRNGGRGSGGGGRGGGGFRGQQQNGGNSSRRGQEAEPVPDMATWVAALPPIRSPGDVQPVGLPLQVCWVVGRRRERGGNVALVVSGSLGFRGLGSQS